MKWETHLVCATDSPGAELPSDLNEAFRHVTVFEDGKTDAEVLDLLGSSKYSCRLLVIDHYGFNDERIQKFREAPVSSSITIIVIDDEARRTLEAADLIINPGPSAHVSQYGKRQRVLCGSPFSLLREAFSVRPGASPLCSGSPWAAIVFGGTDPSQLTAWALQCFAEFARDEIWPWVIASKSDSRQNSIEARLACFPKAEWQDNLSASEVASVFRRCRFGPSACGGTAYEMLSCGLPFIGIVTTRNQEAMGRALAQRWKLPVIDGRLRSADSLEMSWRLLQTRFPITEEGTRYAFSGIDGRGAQRVLDAIVGIM